MKTLLKLILPLVMAGVIVFPGYAQMEFGPQWGGENSTQEERTQNVLKYNFYRDAYQAKDYNQALEYLPDLLESVPQGHENIYIFAINIYQSRILAARSLADKNERIDSLMMLYDLRLENFGTDPEASAEIAYRKALAFEEYKPNDTRTLKTYFKDIFLRGGDQTPLNAYNYYMQFLANEYNARNLEADELMEEYDFLSELMASPAYADPQFDSEKEIFDKIFIATGLADCEMLEQIYAPQLAAKPDDVALHNRVVALLWRQKCQGAFFLSTAERYHQLAPSSITAIFMARAYQAAGDTGKSNQYLEEALRLETDPAAKTNLYLEMAMGDLQSGNARRAAEFARQLISANPNEGMGYFILGSAYAAGSSSCAGFDRQTVYWLVVDNLQRARTLLPSDHPVLNSINGQIGTYTANFPTQEDCFYRNFFDGNSYTVNCGWISGTTTVRSRK